jgi:hypothetical protein
MRKLLSTTKETRSVPWFVWLLKIFVTIRYQPRQGPVL